MSFLIGNIQASWGSAGELASASYLHRSGHVASASAAGDGALTSSAAQPKISYADTTLGVPALVSPVGSDLSLTSLIPGFWAIVTGGLPSLDLDSDLVQFFLDEDDDGDGLLDVHETATGTLVSATNTGSSPVHADSDGDGFDDGTEIQAGFDPNDAASRPVSTAVPSVGRPLQLLLLGLLIGLSAFTLASHRRNASC